MPSEEDLGSGASLEGEADEREEVMGGAPDLRPFALAVSPEAASEYRVAAYSRELDGASLSCSIIPVAEVEGLLLVAVPHNAWHRLAAKRYLPRGTLAKAVHTEVLAAEPGDRGKPHGHFKVKLWLGILAGEAEEHLVFGGVDEPTERGFVIAGTERPIFPYGPSLTAAARDLFTFVSAAEDAPQGPPGAQRPEPDQDLAAKVKSIENAVFGLQGGLDAIRQQLERVPGAEGQTKPHGTPKASAQPRAAGGRSKVSRKVEGLDPTVLAAARAAGVPEDQLDRMGELARKPGRLGDGARAAASPLSESDGEDEEGGDDAAAAPESVSVAICKMTEILGRLAKGKRSNSLEDLLDRGDGLETAASSSSGGSSKSAAYAKLTALLKEDPEKISKSVLKLMAEDYGAHTSAPGMDGVHMTARSWLEHRSRVQQYAGPVRWGWQTAGALDALLSGKVEECKARLWIKVRWIQEIGFWLRKCTWNRLPHCQASGNTNHRTRGRSTGRSSWTRDGCPC